MHRQMAREHSSDNASARDSHQLLPAASVFSSAIHGVDDSHSSINDRTITSLNELGVHEKLQPLLLTSIGLKTPLAQFLIDCYTLSAMEDGLTINEFFEQSRTLSAIPKDDKAWTLPRAHLSQHFKHVFEPVLPSRQDDEDSDSDDDDDFCGIDDDETKDQESKPNVKTGYSSNDTDEKSPRDIEPSALSMASITYFMYTIHRDLRLNPLNNFVQIDLLFVSQSDPEAIITDEHFETMGVKYEALGADRNIYKMLKRFNQQHSGKNRRCVLLILMSDEPANAMLYIYEPRFHNTIPSETREFTEIAYLLGTKSLFENLPVQTSNALCVSIHMHGVADEGDSVCVDDRVERVYVTDGVRNARVLKSSFKTTLTHFGVEEEEDFNNVEWEDSVQNPEFNDHQFHVFADTLFSDFGSPTASVRDYQKEREQKQHRWTQLLATMQATCKD